MASIRTVKTRMHRAAFAPIAVQFPALTDKILLSSRPEGRLKVGLGF